MIDKQYLGSDFDDFLRKEGFIDDAEAVAAKRVIDENKQAGCRSPSGSIK